MLLQAVHVHLYTTQATQPANIIIKYEDPISGLTFSEKPTSDYYKRCDLLFF